MAASLCALTACTPTPAPPTSPPAAAQPKDDCNSQPCVLANLSTLLCTSSGQRQFKLAVTNERSVAARYRLDYFVPEITLEQGDGLGHFTVEGKQQQEHIFTSATFNRALKVTVTQLDTGNNIVHEVTPEVTLKRC